MPELAPVAAYQYARPPKKRIWPHNVACDSSKIPSPLGAPVSGLLRVGDDASTSGAPSPFGFVSPKKHDRI